MSLTLPSAVIQTYMTFTAKRWGQFPTITIVSGATAGHEFCTMDTSWNITIHIASGVSTMAQVATAVAAGSPSLSNIAVAGDLVSLVVTTGHNSDTVTTASITSLTGAVSANNVEFWTNQAAVTLTTSYQFIPFGFGARFINIHTTDTNPAHILIVSLDGVETLDEITGSALAGQDASSVETYQINAVGIWMKYSGTVASPWELSAW